MKYRLILLISASIQMYNLFGQNPVCIPNPLYKDSTAGIYPRPYNDSTKTGGIDRVACIDEDFEFPLTVNIPDMVTVTLAGAPITLSLESAKLDTVKAVKGLPVGIKYYCNPATCEMKKNTLGCVVLKGKPTAANQPGDYNLEITLSLVTFIGTIDVLFPGALFPGKYSIKLAAKGSLECLKSSTASAQAFEGMVSAFPNPTVESLKIQIMAMKKGEAIMSVSDITGRIIRSQKLNLSQGENQFLIPVNELSNGTYFYTINQGGLGVSRKFLVWHD